jgi:tetratricopeptide (TPR) repeat protein
LLFLFPNHLQTLFANLRSNRYLRLIVVIILVGFCLWTIRDSGAFGVSRLLDRFSMANFDLAIADKAVKLAPTDAQAHFAAAAVLSTLNRTPESAVEMERSVALRPSDYALWSQLGLLRDQLGDTAGALAAFDEAVRLAPFYARPRWQRGNLLVRAGSYEQGFQDLSRAALSNPELIPALIDLAWNVSKGDPNLTEQWSQIKTDQGRIAFAKFLARRGKGPEVIAQLRKIAVVPEDSRRQLVEELVAKGAFESAYEVWKAGRGDQVPVPQPKPQIYDGGFEAPLTFDATGFGWRVSRNVQGIALSLNSSAPHTGSRNLRIDFSGNSDPGAGLISQLILVEPSRIYQINFASRSQDIVTGGLPIVVVTDAQGERKRLGQTPPLSGVNDWKTVEL